MSDTVNNREEQQLLDAVKAATDLVTAGLSPNDAVTKVAKDNGFGPGKIRLIGQAYNTGQQLGQWRHPGGALDKLASFPMCDPDAVINALYLKHGEKSAAVIDPAYSRKPVFAETVAAKREKTASYKLPGTTATVAETKPSLDTAFGNIQRAKQARDEACRRASASKDALMTKVAELVQYFRLAPSQRLAFQTVKTAAMTYMGDEAKLLMDVVQQRLPVVEKAASAQMYQPVDLNKEPFVAVRTAIKLAGDVYTLEKTASALKNAYERAKSEELRPFAKAAHVAAETGLEGPNLFGVGEKRGFGIVPEIGAIAAGDILAHKATHNETPADPYGDVASLDEELAAINRQSQQAIGMRRKPRVKSAFFGVGLGTAIGSSMGKTLGAPGKTRDSLVDDAWMGLEDPEHENELRKIKAHAMINQMLTDPNDPISAHDPDKVLNAYNEISQTAPRVAENVATLRPALRKRLEGHTEPFESKELLDIEHGLAKTKTPTPNTSLLGGSAPDSLLG